MRPAAARRRCAAPFSPPPSPPQELYEYNDAEWDALGFGRDASWSREETDYLFSLCSQYDLRFPVIADRYCWAGAAPPLPGVEPAARGVHELKARYYGIAHALIRSRTDSPEEVAHKELIRHPYAAAEEAERRETLSSLLSRSAADDAADAALLEAAGEVEARRRAEVEAARAAGLPLPLYCRAGAPDAALSIALEDVDVSRDPGGPELPTPRGVSLRPPPGAYVRGVHTIAMSNELALAAPAAATGQRRDRKAADSFNKKVDLTMEELGVRPPQTATRAVCRAWYALRKEVAAMLELRQLLARRSKELAGGAGTPIFGGGGSFGGLPGSAGGRGGGSEAQLTPFKPGWGGQAGAAGGGLPLSPSGEEGEEGRSSKREHKRKLPYEAKAASPPKQANKRPKGPGRM